MTNETTSFAHYDSYEFTDYSKSFSPEEETLFEGTTDENGKARFPPIFRLKIQHPEC